MSVRNTRWSSFASRARIRIPIRSSLRPVSDEASSRGVMRRVPPLRRRSAMHTAAGAVWAAALLAASRLAHAAPEEIQVYVDDLTPPGRFGMDVHNNYVLS